MAAAVGAVIGGVISFIGSSKSAKAQSKAIKAQERQQALADARERRKLLRQSQILAGQGLNTGAVMGGLGSSGLTGGMFNLGNQAQSQIGFQNQSFLLGKEYNKYMQQASNWDMWGQGLGSMFGKMNLGTFGVTGSGAKFVPPSF